MAPWDLTDNEGLDQQLSSHRSGLNFGSGGTGSAVLVNNPEGERTLTIKGGLGRTVRVVQLDSNGDALTSVTTTYEAVVRYLLGGGVGGNIVGLQTCHLPLALVTRTPLGCGHAALGAFHAKVDSFGAGGRTAAGGYCSVRTGGPRHRGW